MGDIAAGIIEREAASIEESWLKGAVEVLRTGGWPVDAEVTEGLRSDVRAVLAGLQTSLRGGDLSPMPLDLRFVGATSMDRLERDASLVSLYKLYSLLSNRLGYAIYNGIPADYDPQAALDLHQDVVTSLRSLVGQSPCSFIRAVEVRLTDQQRKIAEVYNSMLGAQETERRRIARDVHDVLAQALAGARFRTETALRLMGKGAAVDVEQVALEVAEVKQLVEYTLAHVRDIIFDLHPATLDRAGLKSAVHEHVSRLPNDEVEIAVSGTGGARVLSLQTETALFRIVQEALANVVAHSGARRASVHIDTNAAGAIVTIEDAGVGFDVESALAASGREGRHYGLLSMRERAEAIGGTFNIASRRGAGTQIRIAVPVSVKD